MKQRLLFSIFACLLAGSVFAQSGTITVTSVAQRSDGSGLVDVFYNLSGNESSYSVSMRVSFDAGTSYSPISSASLSGAIGMISPGSNKYVVWDPTIDHPNRYSHATKLKLIASVINLSNACSGNPTVTDYDGNVYNTVQIGNQCWMASNLNTTRTYNGDPIIRYCNQCDSYGGLYTWSTVMDGSLSSNSNPSGVQGICPDGWHVPSDAEWTELTNYLLDNYLDINLLNIANKLKSCRQISSPLGGDCNTSVHPRWSSYSTHYGTNDFGFSALPAGNSTSGSFGNLGSIGSWWSATEYSSTSVWYRIMDYNNGNVTRSYNSKAYGFSIRCLRD